MDGQPLTTEEKVARILDMVGTWSEEQISLLEPSQITHLHSVIVFHTSLSSSRYEKQLQKRLQKVRQA